MMRGTGCGMRDRTGSCKVGIICPMSDSGTQSYKKDDLSGTGKGSDEFTEDHIEKLADLFGESMIVPDDDDQDTGEFMPVKDDDSAPVVPDKSEE